MKSTVEDVANGEVIELALSRNLKLVEHEQAMNGAYKSFWINGRGKTDVNSYITLVKPKIQKLIEEQVNVLDAAMIQVHMFVMWKKKGTL